MMMSLANMIAFLHFSAAVIQQLSYSINQQINVVHFAESISILNFLLCKKCEIVRLARSGSSG